MFTLYHTRASLSIRICTRAIKCKQLSSSCFYFVRTSHSVQRLEKANQSYKQRNKPLTGSKRLADVWGYFAICMMTLSRGIRLTAQYLKIRAARSEGCIPSISAGCSSRANANSCRSWKWCWSMWSVKQEQNFCSMYGIGISKVFHLPNVYCSEVVPGV